MAKVTGYLLYYEGTDGVRPVRVYKDLVAATDEVSRVNKALDKYRKIWPRSEDFGSTKEYLEEVWALQDIARTELEDVHLFRAFGDEIYCLEEITLIE